MQIVIFFFFFFFVGGGGGGQKVCFGLQYLSLLDFDLVLSDCNDF